MDQRQDRRHGGVADSSSSIGCCAGAGRSNQVRPLEQQDLLLAAAQRQDFKEVKRLAGEVSAAHRLQADSQGRTALHLLARHSSHESVAALLQLAARLSKWQLSLYDADGNCLLHVAATNSRHPTVLAELAANVGHEQLLKINRRGVTPLHVAAQWKTVSSKQLQLMQEQLKQSCLQLLQLEDGQRRSVAFSACLGHNFQLLPQSDEDLKQLVRQTDADGNTLLHAMFMKFSYLNDFDLPEWTENFLRLVRVGCDPKQENSWGFNCLLASEMHHEDLDAILTTTNDDLERHLQKLLTNSKGEHAVHVFSGRYEIEYRLKNLSQLSDMTEDELLKLKVAGGRLKGGTCLHFACELGNFENFKFLVKRHNFDMAARTDAGQSCIDVAYDKDKAETLIEKLMKEEKILEALRLVDRPQASLPQLPQWKARRVLETFTNRAVRKERSQADDEALVAHARRELQILLRAVELDSAQILRSLCALYSVDADLLLQFPAHFCEFARATGSFRDIEIFLESRRPDSMSAAEIAVHFERVTVAADLLLLQQHDLVPACVRLLLQLKRPVAQQKGKHDQLLRLQESVSHIAVRALQLLYQNASSGDKERLFSFLRGDFEKDGSPGPRGPRFEPGPAGEGEQAGKEFSVMELVKQLGSPQLLGTDCLHEMTQQEWSGGSPAFPAFSGCCDRPSCPPRVKFWIQFFAQLVFLVFLAWLVTDFRRSLDCPGCWVWGICLLLYAASYSAQEIDELVAKIRRVDYKLPGRPRLPRYFKDALNSFDISALIFLWIGSIWYVFLFIVDKDGSTARVCQMLLASSFLLWGFRSIGMLSFFEKTGLVIAMMHDLLMKDLLPFLIILLVIVMSFGVFFFNLLFPVLSVSTATDTNSGAYVEQVLKAMLTLPLRLMFGLLEFGDLTPSNGTNQQVGSVADSDGLGAFTWIFMFIFMLLVNIVMVNLLIALFNLTVNRIANESVGIWRRKNFEMLREYKLLSVVPPPFSILYYAAAFVGFLVGRCGSQGRDVSECIQWWWDESQYPEEYKRFLLYQALQLRQHRASLREVAGQEVQAATSADEKVEKLSRTVSKLRKQMRTLRGE